MSWPTAKRLQLRDLWNSGTLLADICERLGRSETAVKVQLRELREQGYHLARTGERILLRAGQAPADPRPLTWKQLVNRRRQRPDDTRTLTARCFGDPLPGESALDREGAGS